MAEIKLPKNLAAGRFIKRLNRFVALVKVEGREAKAHVPSSGRMHELLVPGAPVYLAPAAGLQRRTEYKLLLVEYSGIWVSVDSLLPNRLLNQAFQAGEIHGFFHYHTIRREFSYRGGRLDFMLSNAHERCLVEVKSVTMIEDGEALFPDAPTARGTRHLHELAQAAGEGYRAAVFFVVQREDGLRFAPNDQRDPDFGEALRRAQRLGVEVYALQCRVTPQMVTLLGYIPVVT